MKKIYFLLLSFIPFFLQAQGSDAVSTEAIKATEFTIPAAPAYMLLDASSPLVNQPGNIRDFKVDWSLRSYALQPNIALEGQPIWEAFYNRADLSKYQKASGFMRTLSTLSLSAGTLQKNQNFTKSDTAGNSLVFSVPVNQLAVALKVNLYRQYDPLMDEEIYKPSATEFIKQKADLQKRMQTLTDSLPKIKTEKIKKDVESQIESTKASLATLNATQKEVVKGLRTTYVKEHWNASMVDFAIGKVFNYDRPIVDSLHLINSGLGVWLNGSFGIGKKGLLCATTRYTQMDTANIFGRDTLGIVSSGPTRIWGVGANYRYGSPRFNFFVEGLYNVLQNDPKAKDKFTLAYGGDFKVGNNVVIGYAIRTIFDKNMKFTNLIPVANVNCLMR